MDMDRKKALQDAYRNRHPEMGVCSYKCKATGESFLEASKDTKATFNKTSFELSMGSLRNRHFQKLWNQYGADGFEQSVLGAIDYKNIEDVSSADLSELLEQCLTEDSHAVKFR